MASKLVRVKIAISRCLLGDAVRYDATARYSAEIEKFKEYDIIPFCPEVATGMGVPRPPIQLELINNDILARRCDGEKIDYTSKLAGFAESFVSQHPDLCAVINKRSSPSCGHQSAKLFEGNQLIHQQADGIFIDTVKKRLPGIVIVDEEELGRPEKSKAFQAYLKQKALQGQD